MRKHCCRQHVELSNVTTPYKKTTNMQTDFLSKQTPKPTHERHRTHTFGDQALGPALYKIQQVVQWFQPFDTNAVEEGWYNRQQHHVSVKLASSCRQFARTCLALIETVFARDLIEYAGTFHVAISYEVSTSLLTYSSRCKDSICSLCLWYGYI